jgi:hypothetical protein
LIGWIGFRCRYSPPGSNAAEGRKAEASSDKPDPFEHFFALLSMVNRSRLLARI